MNRVAGVAVAALATVATAGCGGSSSDDEVVQVFGPWRGDEADRFEGVLAPFEAVSGIDVQYVGSDTLVRDLLDRATGASDPPDVALVPQQGVIEELVADARLVPLADEARGQVVDNYGVDDLLIDTGDDEVYTVPFRVTVKSLVWYRPEVFEDNGWAVPETLQELTDLVDTIDDESEIAPWCLAIEAGAATGWSATDWVEDIVLRTEGGEGYDDWASGAIGFADDSIADAFDSFYDLVLEDGRTAGGRAAVVETAVDEGVLPMFDDPPGCAMYKQADFAAGWMPEGTTIGPDGDVDVFVLPGDDPDNPAPLIVGGDQAVQFRRSVSIDALMAYLATSAAGEFWARQGGFISAHPDVEGDVYPDEYRQTIARVVQEASELGVDASDQMPASIGSDLFWELITEWIAGLVDYDEMAAQLDEAMQEANTGENN